MNKETNNLSVFLNVAVIAVIVGVVLLFLWQLKMNVALRQELSMKKQDFKDAKAASKHLKALEAQAVDLKLKSAALHKRVPLAEEEPFSLIKTIMRLGGEVGLQDISLGLKKKTSGVEGAAASGAGGLPGEAQGEDGGAQQNYPPDQSATQVNPSAPGEIREVYLDVNCEGNIQQLLIFLEKLMNLERLVKVDGIKIEREKEILPYQKISLEIVTYTF